MTVLFLWQVPDRMRTYLQDGLPDVHLVFPENDDMLAHTGAADIVVGWRPTAEFLDAAKNLRLFINPGTGVRHLVPLMRGRNITVVNGHGHAEFVAQHAVALLLALCNKIVPHHNWMAAGEWRKGDADAATIPLEGKTVGLLGYGAINQCVHKLLQGFDLSFAIHRRSGETTLDEFLTQTNILIAAVPDTEETKGMIGSRELELLGPSALIVNVGRGSLIEEEPLYRALKEGRIGGAGLDVWYDYSPEPDDDGHRYPYHFPFHELPNVVLSPHRAASPGDHLRRWDDVIENINRFAAGRGDLLNVVDLDRGY